MSKKCEDTQLVWGPAPSQPGRVWQHAYTQVVSCSRNLATL